MRIRFLLVFLALVAAAPQAQAQLVRAFVSVSGLDTNPCTRHQPCRSFGTAMNAVAAGGEIIPLDTGGYGAFVIDRGVKVISPSGIHAAVTATSGKAIDVQVGPGASVVLRGLVLNSQGAATGISFTKGDLLHVESCEVQNFTSQNLVMSRSSGSGVARLLVSNSTFRQNDIGNGLVLDSPLEGYAIEAVVYGSHVENAANGIMVSGQASLVLATSTVAGNAVGVLLSGDQDLFTVASVVDSHLINNSSSGLNAESGGTVVVRLGRSTISANDEGVRIGAGTSALSTGDNTIEGNLTADVIGVLATYPTF